MSDVTKIQNPSITPKDFTIQDNKIIAISGIPVSGAGGTTSDYVYYPSFDETNGNITFTLGTTQSQPGPFGPYHISGAQGEQGASGYTPEFRINPDNKDHWEWRYTENDDWHDLGIAASGIEGPRGPQGVPGLNGKSLTATVDPYSNEDPTTHRIDYGYTVTIADEIGSKFFNLYSPTVTTSTITSGNRVTFTYAGSHSTYIDVMSGAKGDTGTSGISPVITTAAIGEREGHPQGGTQVTVSDIDHPDGQSFIVWNGINGQGATVELKDGNGIHVTNNGNEYIIAVSADYATKAYAEEASAAAYNKAHAEIPSLDDYYHKNETSGANEIATALAQKLDIEDLPNYDGENGIYVDDTNHKIGISADYKAQIEAVSGKLTSPVTEVGVDDHRLYDANGQTWEPLDDALEDEGVLLEQDLNTVLKPTNGISGNYNNSEYTFGLSAEYENAIKAVSGKVNAPPAGATGKKVYNAGTSAWENFIITLPMNIGNNNAVTQDSIGAIGKICSVGNESMAISYDGASAYQNSMAFGDSNFASANSMAAGWGVKATDYSVIFGHGTTTDPSEVRHYSFAAGDAVFAYDYSQAFGRGLEIHGTAYNDGTGETVDIGGMVIGGYNKTISGALFVIGNGTWRKNTPGTRGKSDAFVVTYDGTVIEGYNNTNTKLSGLLDANHLEGAYNQVSGVYDHIEGHANSIYGYGVHVQGGYNQFFINNVSADTSHTDVTNRWNIWGQSIEGMANATTAEPISGYNGTEPLYTHGGILKVIGNGTRTLTNPSNPATEVITRSDALRLYRDGSMWIQGELSAGKISNANGSDSVGSYSGINNIQVYPAGTNTSNFPNDGVLRIVLES